MKRKSLKNEVLILIGFIFFLPTPLFSAPLSDLAQDQLEQGSLKPTPRSPFVPDARLGDELDPSTLLVQGLIYGKSLKMAILSGRMVREGEDLGHYKVDKILPKEVVLTHSQNESSFHVKLDNYMAPVNKKNGGGFVVEFRNAALKDALKFLAKGAGMNIIVPEDFAGRVTLSFDDMDLLDALRSVLRVNGYEYAIEDKIIRVGKPDAFAGGTDLKTQNFQLRYATAKDMVEKIKLLLSDRGAVISDDRINMLTVKDRDPIISNIAKLVAEVDRRDKQVQIEARIVDASRNFTRSLGINWDINGANGRTTIGGVSTVGTNSTTKNPLNVNLGVANPTSGIGLIIGRLSGFNIETQLTAAEQKGDISILSKPSVTTLNNMPSKIRSGTKIYVKSTSSISVGTAGGTAANAGTSGLQEINTGIELTVTPQITVDDYIKMKIDAVESEADFSRTVDGIPSVIDNTASTSVILKDGETTVIGGLYKQKTTKQKSGVPGLQNIPVMGYLFQSKTRTRSDGELMIFVTPKIVN